MPESKGEQSQDPKSREKSSITTQTTEVPHRIKYLGRYLAVATAAGTVGLIWAASSIDVNGGPKKGSALEPKVKQAPAGKLSGVGFLPLLQQTQEIPRREPLVLANYDLSRVVDDKYEDGNNSVERVSVSAATCILPSGATAKPTPISRIIFRNDSNGTRRYQKGYLSEAHIANTERYRTVFRQQYETNGKTVKEPIGFNYNSLTDIFEQTEKEVCGVKGAEMVEPSLTSHRVLIDQSAYSGQPTYDASGNGGGGFKDTLAFIGLASIAVGIVAGLKKLNIIH